MKKTPYDDIIHLPHHVSKVHPQMPSGARAAQFSAFAALVGFGDIIDETARQTVPKRELDESEKAELDRKIAVLSIGYADGIPRGLSNRGRVLINGCFAPMIGNICMKTSRH